MHCLTRNITSCLHKSNVLSWLIHGHYTVTSSQIHSRLMSNYTLYDYISFFIITMLPLGNTYQLKKDKQMRTTFKLDFER